MQNQNVNYGGKTPNPRTSPKYLKIPFSNLSQVNINLKSPFLPGFIKTIQPLVIGGLYVKTFNNYY